MGEDKNIAKACMENDVDLVKQLLEQGTDVKAPVAWTDKDGKEMETPPIFIAVDYNHIDALQVFLEQEGLEVDIKDDNDYSPLHYACFNGHLEIAKLLILKYNATADEEGLDLAKESGHDEIVKLMLEHVDLYSGLEGDVDEIMMKACREGDVTTVRKMMDEGYDYQKFKGEDGKYQQYSPIFMAMKNGHINIIQVFVEAGIEVELQEENEIEPQENSENEAQEENEIEPQEENESS